MKTLKIVVMLMLFGLSQAGATGFTYNMFAAQKMLKAKKENPALLKTARPERRAPKEVIHTAPPRKAALDMEQHVLENNDDLSEKVVTSFSQVVSNFLIRILSLGMSR